MNKQTKASPEFLDMFGKPEPFEVEAIPVATAYRVKIDEDFESVSQFENVVRVLEHANPNDILEIKLATNGGALHSILPLLAAMEATKAQVYVHAISDVASAGTLPLLAADDVFINPYVTIMFHQVQFGSGGPGSSVEAHVNHTMKSSKQLLHDYYQDFFTEAEIDAMLAGKDFYMGKEEFDERYKRRNELREARLDKEIEDLKEKIAEQTKPVKQVRKKKVKAVVVPDEE